MPTTFCKSSYFGHNMLKTPVLPDAKLGFLDGLSPEKFKLLRAVKCGSHLPAHTWATVVSTGAAVASVGSADGVSITGIALAG